MIVFESSRPFSFGHKIKSFRRREEFQSPKRKREIKKERESSPLLNTLSSSSSNFFLSSLTTHFVTHGDSAPAFISFRWFSRGRGIVHPFLLRSICGRRCRNFPRFLSRPTKPWASSPNRRRMNEILDCQTVALVHTRDKPLKNVASIQKRGKFAPLEMLRSWEKENWRKSVTMIGMVKVASSDVAATRGRENGGCFLCWTPKQLPTHTGRSDPLSVLILEARSTLKARRKEWTKSRMQEADDECHTGEKKKRSLKGEENSDGGELPTMRDRRCERLCRWRTSSKDRVSAGWEPTRGPTSPRLADVYSALAEMSGFSLFLFILSAMCTDYPRPEVARLSNRPFPISQEFLFLLLHARVCSRDRQPKEKDFRMRNFHRLIP